MKELQYPTMRDELVGYLRDLSRTSLPKNELPFVDFVVHFLFDDTTLAEDASQCIGVFLRDEAEAEAISEVVSALDRLFDCHGDLPDNEYIQCPEWGIVALSAQKALSLLLQF